MGRYNDKGVPLEQVSNLTKEETALFVVSDYNSKEKLIFVTSNGLVKRVVLSEFDSTRKTTDATKLDAEDKLMLVDVIKDKQSVVMISKSEMCVVFDCASAKLLKKIQWESLE